MGNLTIYLKTIEDIQELEPFLDLASAAKSIDSIISKYHEYELSKIKGVVVAKQLGQQTGQINRLEDKYHMLLVDYPYNNPQKRNFKPGEELVNIIGGYTNRGDILLITNNYCDYIKNKFEQRGFKVIHL